MREIPDNALPVGRLPRPTIPEPLDRPNVRARIVAGDQVQHFAGVAHAWTADAVCVWWTDRADGLRRIDWLSARDVHRVG